MAFPTHRTRRGYRAAAACALAAGLIALPAGCESLRPEVTPEPVARSAEPSPPPAAAAVPTQPGKFATRSGCCVFYTDFELDKNDPVFADLDTLPEQIAAELKLPPSNAIVQVFLFDTQERYERFMFTPKAGRYWKQPPRRAYFFAEPRVGGGDDLKVYTWLGEPNTLRTDLRHELTHAFLHGILKDVPLWLDEGLASYFELPPANEGVNPSHLDVLRSGPFQPDLARLETFQQVRQMEKPEYREAWAWVHFMLRGNPGGQKVLHDHLQALRTSANPGPLLAKLRDAYPDPDQALLEHLARIEFPRPRRR
ncbi:MAG TPA: hypothetical protein VM529_08280 [Gemmata sp.]|nr:hypothetical protein [Gemmata sp.]